MRRRTPRTQKKKKLKWWHILLIILLIGAIGGAGAKTKHGHSKADDTASVESVQESPAPTSAPTTSSTLEAQSSNPLLAYSDYEVIDVTNGLFGQVIFTRAYIAAEKDVFASASGPEFEEFCSIVAADALEACDWFTVDYGDGTGLNFSAGLPLAPTYCYIDDFGMNSESIIYYTVKDWVVTETYPEQEVQEEPTAASEPMVWVAASGEGSKYHRKSTCSGMNDAIQMSKSDAEAYGYTPCQKNCCYG